MNIVEKKRLLKHMTITELAEKTGIEWHHLKRIETGVIKFPRMETVKKLAAVLGFTLSEFYEEAARL